MQSRAEDLIYDNSEIGVWPLAMEGKVWNKDFGCPKQF